MALLKITDVVQAPPDEALRVSFLDSPVARQAPHRRGGVAPGRHGRVPPEAAAGNEPRPHGHQAANRPPLGSPGDRPRPDRPVRSLPGPFLAAPAPSAGVARRPLVVAPG